MDIKLPIMNCSVTQFAILGIDGFLKFRYPFHLKLAIRQPILIRCTFILRDMEVFKDKVCYVSTISNHTDVHSHQKFQKITVKPFTYLLPGFKMISYS